MDKLYFESILVCPACKSKINTKIDSGKCSKCKLPYEKVGGIWHLLYVKNRATRTSQKQYDDTHLSALKGPDDGSYEILAAFARGNRTVDIACGQGHIEKLAPQTVGVEFSKNALVAAKRNGAKYLVLADAHALPFKNNSFDISISAGNLEHFTNPQRAIAEMARVSKIQIMTIHREFNFPGARLARKTLTMLLKIKNQPIEKPMKWDEVERMLTSAGLKIIFKGFWTLPVNFGRILPILPVLQKIPSCYFVISKK